MDKRERPTLEDQIRLSKMSREELIDLLMPHGVIENVFFWMHNHCFFLWRLLRWNWFNVWTGEKGLWKFAKHGFREWKEDVNG